MIYISRLLGNDDSNVPDGNIIVSPTVSPSVTEHRQMDTSTIIFDDEILNTIARITSGPGMYLY